MRRKEAIQNARREAFAEGSKNERAIRQQCLEREKHLAELRIRPVQSEMTELARRNADLTLELRKLRLLAALTLGVEKSIIFPPARVKAAVQQIEDGCTIILEHDAIEDTISAVLVARPGRETAPWQRGTIEKPVRS